MGAQHAPAPGPAPATSGAGSSAARGGPVASHRPPAMAGAVGVHIGGTACRAAAAFDADHIWRAALPPAGVAAICDAVVTAVLQVQPAPRYVVVGTPGHVDPAAGCVSGAANLGEE